MSKYSKAIKKLRKDTTYNLKQLKSECNFHPRTVSAWVKEFNLTIIQERPLLIFSEVLRDHLSKQLKARKFKLTEQQFPCLVCKKPSLPLQNKVYFEYLGKTVVLRAVCSDCKRMMRKPQAQKKLRIIKPFFKKITLEELHILGRTNSNEKTHLKKNLTSPSNEPCTDSHLLKQKSFL